MKTEESLIFLKDHGNVRSLLSERLARYSFADYGFAKLTQPLTISIYNDWLKKGFHGDMKYLENHAAQKSDPTLLMAKAKSAIVISKSYLPHPYPAPSPLSHSRLALYARGKDYHHELRRELDSLCVELQQAFPNEVFVPMSDSSPVLERDLARRAGLGFVGKNTCLIHPKKGSLFFIAEIYTTLDLQEEETPGSEHPPKIWPDLCGKCRRCIDVCPTGALTQPRELDARKCISYLTIESKEDPPLELRKKIGDWLFGCDLCQTVCPWNLKWHGADIKTENPGANRDELLKDLRWLLTSSNKALQKSFAGSPLSRAAGNKLKRNALVIIANLRLLELEAEVNALLSHKSLSSLAVWCLDNLTSPH